ncbi:MAG TPA: 3-dehydroquinate synthase, partial [Luteimonas sp.]|nr:3-dehydroquinate synthase [Luteimonas sp.]
MTQPHSIEVAGARPYRITIGHGLLSDGAALAAHVRGRQALVVSDDRVAPPYLQPLCDALQAARPDLVLASHVIAAGEASKTLDGFTGVIDALALLG